MKVVALAQAKNQLSACVDLAQQERVLVTRHGRPAAVIVGVAGEDLQTLLTRSDPEFWTMIRSRRERPGTLYTSQDVRELLHIPAGLPRRPRRKPRRVRRGT